MNQIRLYLIYRALQGAVFVVPILVTYWRLHGLTLLEVMILQTAFALALALLEVPSGVIADRFGRRRSLIASALVLSSGALVYCHVSSFSGFLLAEVLIAVGCSLSSGIEAAWLFEQLSKLKREGEYSRVYGRGTSVFLVSLGLSNIIGGLVASIDLKLPFFMMLGSFMLLIPVTLSMEESRKESASKKGLVESLLDVGRLVSRDSVMIWLFSYSALILCASQVAFWLYQPLFEVRSIELQYYGWIYASFNLVAAVVASQVEKLKARLGVRQLLQMLWLLNLLGYLLLGFVDTNLCFCFAWLHQIVRGVYRTVISEVIQERVSDEQRASVLSVQGLTGFLAQSAATLIAGVIADSFGVLYALKFSLLATFVIGLSLWLWERRQGSLSTLPAIQS